MEVYMYQADLYCNRCGIDIRKRLRREGKRPSADSGEWPQRHFNGGGEADTPQHCGSGEDCLQPLELGGNKFGCWLENQLTDEGKAYVRDRIAGDPAGQNVVTQFWAEAYDITPDEPDEDELPTEPSDEDLVTQDYQRWFSHGGPGRSVLVVCGDPHAEVECEEGGLAVHWLYAVKKHMDTEQFWPNAWFLGERGDWNLLDLESGGYAAERKA
jgi:hypothetical protein